MLYDEEKLKKFIDKLRYKKCSFCGCKDYTFSPTVFKISELDYEKPTITAVPLIAMMCSKCGHTVLFNAKTAGVYDEPKNEKGHE